MLLSDYVTYLFVLYSVVSKHLLLALSVLFLFAELMAFNFMFCMQSPCIFIRCAKLKPFAVRLKLGMSL